MEKTEEKCHYCNRVGAYFDMGERDYVSVCIYHLQSNASS